MHNTLKNILKGKVVIVGIGNSMKSDDGFGPALIERVKGKVKAVCINAGTTPENYVGAIAREKPDTVLLVDAVHMDLEPGKYEILGPEEIIKSGFTTHDISPKMFIEYLKSETNAAIYMLGIQPERLDLGEEMSAAVMKTLEELSELIASEVKNA